jgi:hypothetical protein
MQPEPPPGLEPIGPGHPMEDIVHLAHGCDVRRESNRMAPTVQLTADLRTLPRRRLAMVPPAQ